MRSAMVFEVTAYLAVLALLQVRAEELTCEYDTACEVLASSGSPGKDFDSSLSLLQLRSRLNRALTNFNATHEGDSERVISGARVEAWPTTGGEQSNTVELSLEGNSSENENLANTNMYNFSFGGRTVKLFENSTVDPERVKELAEHLSQNGASMDEDANYFVALNMERARTQEANMWDNAAGKEELANYYETLNMERQDSPLQTTGVEQSNAAEPSNAVELSSGSNSLENTNIVESGTYNFSFGGRTVKLFENATVDPERVKELAEHLSQNGASMDEDANYFVALNMERARTQEVNMWDNAAGKEELANYYETLNLEHQDLPLQTTVVEQSNANELSSGSNSLENTNITDSGTYNFTFGGRTVKLFENSTADPERVKELAELLSQNGASADEDANYFVALNMERARTQEANMWDNAAGKEELANYYETLNLGHQELPLQTTSVE